MSKLTVQDLSKSFGGKPVLRHLNFSVEDGEFLSVLGASGCGKTTLLRILIGIETADEGTILRDGVDITHVDPAKRSMGIVFQNYALFPHMTALQNVMYPLKFQRELKGQAKEMAQTFLDKVGLQDCLNKKPHQLSGGQQQRVAIARTLALSPEIVLFDEPMSALDAATRLTLRREIKELQKKLDLTILYITHDQEEAFSMSDRIMVMHEGQSLQIGTPKELYNSPADPYVEQFVTQQIQEKLTSIQTSVGV